MNNWPEVIRFVVQIFCVAAMFAMGLGITLDDVKAPFRNLLALAIIVVVNNLLVPILGILIVGAATLLQGTPLAELAEQIVPLTGGEQIGFLLLFLAAGTVVTPFLAGIAGAPIAFSRGIMVVLAGVSALILPIALALLGQFRDVLAGAGNDLAAGPVFVTLLIYQLAPLAIGILIKSQYDVIAQRLRPLIVQFAGLSFLVALAAVVSSSTGFIDQQTEIAALLGIDTFLQALEELPVLGPVVEFLLTLILILLPYAVFVAVTLLLITVGNAAGTVVRSLVAASGSGIPHSLAITTAVRNVTMVLIIAATHLIGITGGTPNRDLGQDAIGIILGFFLVSLIVAAHQAVQWGEETREVVTVVETPAPAQSAPQVINV
jgi:predicted Na+-dependent transporter